MSTQENTLQNSQNFIPKEYRLTIIACVMAAWVYGIGINLIPILFAPLRELYGWEANPEFLGILVAITFVTPIVVAFTINRLADKIGTRPLIYVGTFWIIIGLFILFLVPYIFTSRTILAGIIIGLIVLSAGLGLVHTQLNPLVNALPFKNKARSMAAFHASLAVFMVVSVILTSLGVFFLPLKSWHFIPLIWIIVPLASLILWIKAPIVNPPVIKTLDEHGKSNFRKKRSMLILFFFAMTIGLAAQSIIQSGASFFVDIGLDVPKLIGDILGPAMFSLLLGLGRLLYGLFGKKISIQKLMVFGSLITFFLYLAAALVPTPAIGIMAVALSGFSISLMVPGMMTSTGTKFASDGVLAFIVLSTAGNIGSASGPMIFTSLAGLLNAPFIESLTTAMNWGTPEQASLRLALLMCAVLPLISAALQIAVKRKFSDKISQP